MSSETLYLYRKLHGAPQKAVLMIFSPIGTSNLTIETLHRLDNMLNRKCDNVADIMQGTGNTLCVCFFLFLLPCDFLSTFLLMVET
jgi:hypothetical protein